MKLEFKIEEQDFIKNYLYEASQSANFKKQRLIYFYGFPLIFVVFALFDWYQDNPTYAGTILYLIAALLWLIFYPIRWKNKYKKYYKKFVKDKIEKHLFAEPVILEFNENYVHSYDAIAESKIVYSQFRRCTELGSLFLFQLSNGTNLIVPKRAIKDEQKFKKLFEAFKIPFIDQTKWKF